MMIRIYVDTYLQLYSIYVTLDLYIIIEFSFAVTISL